MQHKKLIGFLLFASLIGIFTITLLQPQPTIPFLPTQTQAAKIPTIQNLTKEWLQEYPSAVENSTDVVATEYFNESFLNLSAPSGVTNIYASIVTLQAHVAEQGLDYAAPHTNIFNTPFTSVFSYSTNNMFTLPTSQIWNETVGTIIIMINGTGTIAEQNCNSVMKQTFTQINQTLFTTYGISVQKLYNNTGAFTFTGMPLELTIGTLILTSLNTSAEVYNALEAIIPDNTFAKTVANENSPSHLIQIANIMAYMSGSLQLQESDLSVGATIEGQIGQSGGSYTFSTRNLLNITAGHNITSQALESDIALLLPTTSNVTKVYPGTFSNWVDSSMIPIISFDSSGSLLSVDDVNVTYTLQSTVPYVVANYNMTNWNMNPGQTANLTLTLTNVGTATAYDVMPYLIIDNATVMLFTYGSISPETPHYSMSPNVGPFTIAPGASVIIDYNVTANQTGSTTIIEDHQFKSYPNAFVDYDPEESFSVHVGVDEPLLEYSTNCSDWVVSPGDNVSVYLTVRNVGTQTATNAMVLNIPNLGPVIDSNVTLPGIGQPWTLGDIPAGEAITANVTSEVDYPTFHTGGTPMMFRVIMAGSLALMPWTLPGLRPTTAAYLEYEKYPAQVTVNINNTVLVNVTVKNLGLETEYVNITDLVPSEYFEVSAGSTTKSDYVTSGGSVTLTYTLKAVKAGTVKLFPPTIAQNYTFAYCTGNLTGVESYPSVAITSPINDACLSSGTFNITWSSSSPNLAYYLVFVDGNLLANVSSIATSYPVSGLSDGSYSVNVTVVNLDGFTGYSVNSFIVDTTRPTVNIASPTSGTTFNTSSVTVNWTGNDALSGIGYFEIRIDSGSWINVSTSTSHTFSGLSNSSHTVDVRAFDKAGNNVTTSVSFTVSLPAAAPPVNLTPMLISLSLMQQQGLPMTYIAIGGIAVVVGLALLIKRAKH